MSDKPESAREVLSRAFAKSEFSPDLAEHEFAGERAGEAVALADVALSALKEAGYSLWRKFTSEEEEANQW